MKKIRLVLCFGVFSLAALTTSRAAVLIDNFLATDGLAWAGPGNGAGVSIGVASGTIAGDRQSSVQTFGIVASPDAYSVVDIRGIAPGARFFRDDGSMGTVLSGGATTAGHSVHTITWTAATPYNLLSLSGSSSTAALSFVVNVVSASAPQLFGITVWEGATWATYGATVSGAGAASFTYTGSSGTQPGLTAVDKISFWADLPSGAAPSFEFSSVAAVPEPTNVALGVFGGLALAVGGVRMGRRLVIARRTA